MDGDNISATEQNISERGDSSGFQAFSSDISAIKTSIVDIAVEIADLKKCVKHQQPNVPKSIVSTFESKESFISFNAEIERDTEKFDNFVNVFKTIFANNQSEIRSNLSQYYKLVLRTCFNKKLILEFTWNSFRGKLAVGCTWISRAIQLSGLEVDSLSTEFDRQNILHKEMSKYKDACRLRKGIPLNLFTETQNELLKFFYLICSPNSCTSQCDRKQFQSSTYGSTNV